MEIGEKLHLLRESLRERGIDAYIITGFDPHQSEYVAPRWRTRAFISGFTGSAGTVVVTGKKALLWVDSRYFIQGERETEGTEFELMKLETEGTPDPYQWLEENMEKGSSVGVDASSVSVSLFSSLSAELKKKDISLVATDDLLSAFWEDRPPLPATPLYEIDERYAGKSAKQKLLEIRNELRKEGLRWTFIASLDDIAWITNLRGSDVPCNPVFVSYLFISLSKAVLFVDKARFQEKGVLQRIKASFDIKPYDSVKEELPKLAKGPGRYSAERIAAAFQKPLSGKKNIQGRDISTDMKARKNVAELEGMRLAHLYDAAAYATFLSLLDKRGHYSEISLAKLLEDERKKIPGYIGPSFNPIAGFRDHGAMCHYSATKESSYEVDGQGLLVLDTGSQFEFGTTDITRTLLFGEATDDEKRDYTLVLKGHIALQRQRFIKGTRGVQLDVLAKQFLWQNGESFYHGTGHGVGCCLNVHEGPHRISSALIDVPLEPGMVVSDEPGLYKEGRYGIRIENLIAVKEDISTEFGEFYSFETLTLVPYEKELIDLSLITPEEKAWIDSYHSMIRSKLWELVEPSVHPWLEDATSPL